MTDSLRKLIDDDRVHVLDGAMGTLLYNRGVFMNVCYDELSLTEPKLVESIHREYLDAGAEIVETNTFGANPVKLSSWGLEEQVEKLNEASARIAVRAANGRAFALGAIGPLGIRIEPWGPTAREGAEAHFRRQVDGLVEGGVHGFVLETFSDLTELQQALKAIRSASDLPVFAQMTVGDDGETSYGTDVETIARTLTAWGVDVVGLNCSVGPAAILDAVERMARVTDLPLSAQPNAGVPRTVGDRKMYLASPEYMGQYARRLIDAGVRFLGGCCGTTPEHIQAIRGTVASLQPPQGPVRVGVADPRASGTSSAGDAVPKDAVPLEQRSRWGSRLSRGEFVTSVEIVPPRGWDTASMVRDAERIRDAGVDTVSVVDSALGRHRIGAIPASLLIEQRVGIETVVHYPCRNRNMMAMISDLLGAAAGGIRNLLLVSGDLIPSGPYPDPGDGVDIDSIGLTNVVHYLNRGMDPGGGSLDPPTEFVIGVAMNQGARDLDAEVRRFGWKVEGGAEFAITQPLFDGAALERFLDRTEEWSIPVVAGVWPLTSLRNAEFLANEVPGIHMPEKVLSRIRDANDRGREATEEEGVRIALEVLETVRHRVQGVHVSAPQGRVDLALRVLEELGGDRVEGAEGEGLGVRTSGAA